MASLCLVLGFVGFSPPTAQADEDYAVQVEITSLSTAALTLSDDEADDDESITIKGKLTNNSAEPMNWVAAEVWRSNNPITTPSALAAATTSATADLLGARLSNADLGQRMQVTMEDYLNPGESATFEVTATREELGFTSEGAYPIGVYIRALDYTGDVQTVGVARWMIPVWDKPASHSALVQLSAPPSMIRLGEFMDDSLSQDVAGRLAALVELAEDPASEFVIDPLLYDSLTALTTPHTIAGDQTEPDTAAQDLLNRIDELLETERGYRLLYGNPDLALAAQTDALESVVTASQALLDEENPASDLPLAVVADADVDDELLQEAGELGEAAVFAASVTESGEDTMRWTPFPASGMGPADTSEVSVRGQLLAEDLVGELAEEPSLRLITSQDDIEQNAASGEQVPLNAAEGMAVWEASETTPAPDELRQELRTVDSQCDLVAELTSSEPQLRVTDRLRVASRSRDFDEGSAIGFSQAFAATLVPRPVTELQTQPSFVMAGNENTFPISVVNNAAAPITVELVFRSSNPQRLETPERQTVTLGAGETATASVRLSAPGGGVVPIEVWVETTSGRKISQSTEIEIIATQAGVLGWVIIIVSGVVVIGSTVWRIRAVQRGKSNSAS